MFDDDEEVTTKKIDEKSNNLNNKLNNILGETKTKRGQTLVDKDKPNPIDRRFTTIDKPNEAKNKNPIFDDEDEGFKKVTKENKPTVNKDKPKLTFFDDEEITKKEEKVEVKKAKIIMEDDEDFIVKRDTKNSPKKNEVKKEKPKVLFTEDDDDLVIKSKPKDVKQDIPKLAFLDDENTGIKTKKIDTKSESKEKTIENINKPIEVVKPQIKENTEALTIQETSVTNKSDDKEFSSVSDKINEKSDLDIVRERKDSVRDSIKKLEEKKNIEDLKKIKSPLVPRFSDISSDRPSQGNNY
jgi:hypothetical protein